VKTLQTKISKNRDFAIKSNAKLSILKTLATFGGEGGLPRPLTNFLIATEDRIDRFGAHKLLDPYEAHRLGQSHGIERCIFGPCPGSLIVGQCLHVIPEGRHDFDGHFICAGYQRT